MTKGRKAPAVTSLSPDSSVFNQNFISSGAHLIFRLDLKVVTIFDKNITGNNVITIFIKLS